MQRIIDKGSLFVLGAILLMAEEHFVTPVLAVLAALIYASLSLCMENPKAVWAVMLIFVCLCGVWRDLIVFFPLLCYDCIWFFPWWGLGIAAAGMLAAVQMHPAGAVEPWQAALWSAAVVLAVLMALGTKKRQRMELDYIHLRDDSTELKLVMQKRQRELMEKQDYEIRLATLQERNRIAREIHDNVGHMLSRSILQMGALLTVHREEPIHGQLEAVNVTLNDAMNSIRESVHDLHNESMDLRQSILDAAKELQNRCEISLDYDMSGQIPRNVKYCFVAIVKEAMSNIAKHSNATRISLLLREHPGFYQMSIEDNGTGIWMSANPGIGLANMTDRVEALGGNIHFFTEQGFRILISVPKEDKEGK